MRLQKPQLETSSFPSPWLLGILIFLSLQISLVAGHSNHNEHAHAHLHHHARVKYEPMVTSTSIAAQSSDIPFSVNQAHLMIKKAMAAISNLNKARLQSYSPSNIYELQNATSRQKAFTQAPPLEWPSASTNTFQSRDYSSKHSEKADLTSRSYSLPAELIDAARIVAEASPPGPTLGNPEAIAARIQAKYRNGMNDTNIPLQRLQQPNGLAVEIPAESRRLNVGNRTDEIINSSDLSKRNTGTSSYWMATMKHRGSSPFAESGYKVFSSPKPWN